MDRIHQNIAYVRRFWAPIVLSCVLLSVTCSIANAQAAVEAAGTSSVSASTATGAKQLGLSTTALPENRNKSPHLAVQPGPAPEVINRKNLEERAGQNAGKVLLRSVPSAAQVWIDGAFVGTTPMLLILAPGKYQVELRGQRLERATRSVDLLPHETREITVPLAARYPARATIR
jgi:PEGA domain